MIDGELRPEMVAALERVKSAGFKVAALTNNMRDESVPPSAHRAVLNDLFARFDAVVESSTAGCRKPERRFYEIACEMLAVAPADCVFLDDLGINLKPAAAMGMTTIKVLSAEQALTDLERVVGLALR
jgi:putative hydrolase of the HAD superfamily